VEQLKPLVAAFEPISKGFREFFAQVDAVMVQWANEKPPSRGYEPWFIGQGFNPILARTMAALQVHVGRRVAMDNRRLPEVVRAVKFLARPHRNRKAISRKVKILLAAWHETSVIETVFSNAGLDEFEFVRLLQAAAEGDWSAYDRLREIAAGLGAHLKIRRGPKLTAPSAAHEFFLREMVQPRKATWTWNPVEERFTDDLTKATSHEFGDPSFDPRPACRRVNDRRRLN
jgi:hypothetical protein